MWGSLQGHLEIVKYLIDEKKTDINEKDNDGLNTQMWASWQGYLE